MWAPPGESKRVIPGTSLTPHQNNNPPALGAIPNMTVRSSNTVTLTATAVDPDTPGQSVTYTLDPGAPPGARVHPVSGLFTWFSPSGQTPGVYPVTLRVTDNGAPSMTDAQTFTITVVPSDATLAIAISGNEYVVAWPLEAGSLQLYSATNIGPAVVWTSVTSTPQVVNGQWVLALSMGTNPSRFFRLQTQ
jgi:hypothetical protein